MVVSGKMDRPYPSPDWLQITIEVNDQQGDISLNVESTNGLVNHAVKESASSGFISFWNDKEMVCVPVSRVKCVRALKLSSNFNHEKGDIQWTPSNS